MEKNRLLEAQRTKLLETKAKELNDMHQRLQNEKEQEIQLAIQQREKFVNFIYLHSSSRNTCQGRTPSHAACATRKGGQ